MAADDLADWWVYVPMTLRKLSDEPVPCMHPEHEPPKNIVLSPGTYEYVCPHCQKKKVFQVHGVYC